MPEVAVRDLYGLGAEIEEMQAAPQALVDWCEAVRDEFHGERLRGARIAWVVVPKMGSKTRVALASCSLLPEVVTLLCDYHYVIRINWEVFAGLREPQRRALIDHELTHAGPVEGADGSFKRWGSRKHDLEEFIEIVQRHGAWDNTVIAMDGAMLRHRQRTLFGSGADSSGA